MKYMSRFTFLACSLMAIAGCQQPSPPTKPNTETNTAVNSKPQPPPDTNKVEATPEQLAKANVNELGQVPILEYHRIDAGKTNYDRTPAAFRQDLDRLYSEGYRPVFLHEYLDNKIDVPLGMTPFVFTFDDSDKTHFNYLADGTLDPDCALAILKAFHEKHPDFGLKATFYINSPVSFMQPALAEKKMKELVALGMEIGNHTLTHPSLKKLSDEGVQKELAMNVAGIHKYVPDAVVDTLALPFGVSPRNKQLSVKGEFGGVSYSNRAVLLVGANPAPSPVSAKFDPLRLPRIQAYEGPLGSTYWLNYFQAHPNRRYISDGDPNTVTVPKADEAKVAKDKLGSAKLRTY